MEEQKDPVISAKEAGLHYVADDRPGIRREKNGHDFKFIDSKGRVIKNNDEITRIRKLGIPPAWTDVWICSDPEGHVQATGRDARGRKQHRYHKRWREVRDETKYNRMVEFAKTLPKIRQRTAQDLAKPGLPIEKVLATVVRILETGVIRVGNEEYAKQNKSFGLTTMRDRHVRVRGAEMRFEFRGKSGKLHNIQLEDPRLAKVVKNCQDIPGQELFQYRDDEGLRRKISSTDVNDYIREITGGDFTAKDFRTWAGTVLAAMALREVEKCDTKAQQKKNVTAAIERVAARLGNTPTICKKCYIHPFVLDAYMDGTLLAQAAAQRARSQHSLNPDEAMVLALLNTRLKAQTKSRQPGALLKQLQASIKHRKKAR
ncbi:MAG TPA: DNA topoisomerase IB [Verrucomicrobiae bacterium]|nr:DNA topoisomerase IB [Verrucomicrobiae bacterium]